MVNREVELSAGLSNVAVLRQGSSGGLSGFPDNSILELGRQSLAPWIWEAITVINGKIIIE